MIVVMQPQASMQEKSSVISWAEEAGFKIHLSTGSERTIVGIIGDERALSRERLERMSGVERVVPVLKPFKIASREFKPDDTKFSIGGHLIGGKDLIIMAGPCSVESRSQIIETAHACKEAGAHILRGGAFKPRSSPYSFQ
ncbi:2-keto-3-deoxy-D-arabino-heptulosonate-7-phosphate synthase I beta, partial [hydrothermal vent metagenome]